MRVAEPVHDTTPATANNGLAGGVWSSRTVADAVLVQVFGAVAVTEYRPGTGVVNTRVALETPTGPAGPVYTNVVDGVVVLAVSDTLRAVQVMGLLGARAKLWGGSLTVSKAVSDVTDEGSMGSIARHRYRVLFRPDAFNTDRVCEVTPEYTTPSVRSVQVVPLGELCHLYVCAFCEVMAKLVC